MSCAGVFIMAEDAEKASSDEKTFAIGTIIEILKKENNLPLKVIVELVSKDNLKMMRRSNVDGIVNPYGITDCLMAQEFVSPGVHDVIHQIISNTVGSQFYILDTKLHGHKVSDIQVAVHEHPANLQVIGIIQQDKQILNPPKSMTIEKGDKLIMLAESTRDFQTIEEDLLKKNLLS
jgi:Trk K+ transport system NAD-binding subunit